VFFCKITKYFYLLSLVIISFLAFFNGHGALGFSPIYERQEIKDLDNDWKFWSFDKDKDTDTIFGKKNELISIPFGNEVNCKLEVGNPPEIKSVSYMSNGQKLDTTIWLSSKINEMDLVENKIDRKNYEQDTKKPLWKKAKFNVAIDINSVFDQGTDYRIEFLYDKINSTLPKWTEVIYELSAFGDEKIISTEKYDKLPYINKNFIEFSIDLNKISNPTNYKLLFYVTNNYIKNGTYCRSIDYTNWVLSPPPTFNIVVPDNPISMNPGEEKDVLVNVIGKTGLQAEAELAIKKNESDLSLNFLSKNVTITSINNGTSFLHINVSKSKFFPTAIQMVFPILANISFTQTLKNKGGDTFYNNNTTFLTETFDLTVNIERSLTELEEFEKKISFLQPIGTTWQILAPIGAALISLIYLIMRKKKILAPIGAALISLIYLIMRKKKKQ
jgi:hypothetical protein